MPTVCINAIFRKNPRAKLEPNKVKIQTKMNKITRKMVGSQKSTIQVFFTI